MFDLGVRDTRPDTRDAALVPAPRTRDQERIEGVTHPDDELALTKAGRADVETVRALLEEVSAWLLGKGLRQWPERFDDEWFVPALHAGETWLASRRGALVATITLQWEDEAVWGPRPPDAGYVHRLAVRRAAAGVGADLLTWAEQETRARGRSFLRLDCWSENTRLREYYETHGFEHRGDTAEWGWTVSRYEKRV